MTTSSSRRVSTALRTGGAQVSIVAGGANARRRSQSREGAQTQPVAQRRAVGRAAQRAQSTAIFAAAAMAL